MVYFDYNGVCKVGTLIETKDDHYVIEEYNSGKILNVPLSHSLSEL